MKRHAARREAVISAAIGSRELWAGVSTRASYPLRAIEVVAGETLDALVARPTIVLM